VGLRIVVVSTVSPIVSALVPRLSELGHEAVALLAARRDPDRPPPDVAALSDANAPVGLDLLYARDKHAIERLLRAYEPDLMVCWGFPWKIPGAALSVPALGSINQHPGLLPRYRGPVPFAWALRNGDSHLGVTWHRMDAELDTGPILAQATVPIEDDDCTIEEIGPKLLHASLGLLPSVLERVRAGDPGDPQPAEGATWAGHFGEDFATIELAQPARRIHDQVRAWQLTFGLAPVPGPILELDGERLRVVRTGLRDPGGGARRVEAGDGPLWIVASEPA
jgi:methionyl-tRNA formyltransferase